MNFTLLLGDEPMGTSALEHFDSDMGVARGKFFPLPAYEVVRKVFHRYSAALAETSAGAPDAESVASFYDERDALPL
jgi:hypothetical protein